MLLPEFLQVFRQSMAILCCLFGLPGNLLTIVVCLKALFHRTVNFERRVFDLYLVEISILDTFILLYWVSETLISYLYAIDRIGFFSLMHLSTFSCFFSFIFNRLCAALSSWLLACFTLIRFMHIFRQFNTIRSNVILLGGQILIFSLANSYLLLVLEFEREEKTNGTFSSHPTSCHIRAKYANDRLTLLLNTLVAGVLNLALPSILILIVNIVMLCFIKRIYTHRTLAEKGPRRSDTNIYRSTRSTLLVISITYTLFYLPYCIFYFLMIILEDRHDTLHYWSEITYILRHVSHSGNFYAYISTNLRFRRDILSLMHHFARPCRYLRQRSSRRKSSEILVETCRLPLPPPPLRRLPNQCSVRAQEMRLIEQQRGEEDHSPLDFTLSVK